MSAPGPQANASPLKRALAAIEKLQARVEELEAGRREPIAIVGLSCRFPGGADSPEAFWQLLRDGVDAVTEIPPDRWDADAYYDPDPDAPGKMATRWGAFLPRVDMFDPQLFGITPREAAAMDPQQRLLLELTWEALERAGIAPDKLSGSPTGVFVGLVNDDYRLLALQRGVLDELGAYFASGTATSVAAGRISYVLGLQGPAVAVDTACSSSLVAVHLAVQSLRAGECRMALAGGANVVLSPEMTIALSKYRMMASDGRCKAFDARADGFVRGEGGAVLVLKRLSDAVAAGDRILAVIRGSAVNQDGPSSGLTAPNGPAQEAVLRAALADGGVAAEEVGYVEAHGTGTALGDPIEVQALDAVLGKGRPADRPLLIGSVKTNIGHLEAAAGVAGLIKTVLALRHGEIPASLHFREPNPLIAWDRMGVRVVSERRVWERGKSGKRIAGVSSFGFSGTNAHVVVEEWVGGEEAERAEAAVERPVEVLTLSARDEKALEELAGRYAVHLEARRDQRLQDVAHTANVGRAHLPHRLAVLASSTTEAVERLRAYGAGATAPGIITGRAPHDDPPEVVFLFTGQGSQYAGMGRELYESSPVFRSALERCAAVLEGELEVPLLEVLYPEPGGRGEGLLDRTEYTQPALFALEWSLAELWRSWGVEPSLVLGHSVGEYVAACVAGVLEVEEALRLVALRGRLMGSLPAGGVMVAVFAPEARVREVVERLGGGQVSIAAVNGPESVVVSGAGEAVERVVGELVGAGVGVQRLRVSHAFHSPLMDPVVGEFERVASGVRYGEARIGVVSNVTGEVVGSEVLGCGSYWARQLREAVRYADGVRALWARGQRVFVEVGPGATLVNLGRTCVPEADQGLWLSSLRSGRGDWETLLSSLAELYVRGVEVDWAGLDRPYRRRRVELPTYPFQRQRYWLNLPQRAVVRRGPTVHPLLGQRVRSPVLDATVFECEIGIGTHAYLTDHRLHEIAVFPAAGYLEMGLAAARQVFGDGAHALEHVVMGEALVLPEEGTRLVQVAVKQEEEGVATFEVFSLVDGDQDTWTRHASGRIRRADRIEETSSATSLEEVGGRCRAELQPADVYEVLTALGAQYGPAFRALSSVRRRDGEALSRIEAPATIESSTGSYLLHPALADACIQTFGPAIEGFSISDRDGNCYMPVEVGSYRLYQPGVRSFRCRVTVVGDRNSDVLRGDVELYDAAGRLIGEMHAVRLLRIDREMLQRVARRASDPRVDDILYRVEWQRIEAPSAEPAPGTWLILADRGGVADALADRLERQGHVVVMVRPDASGGIGRDRIAAALSAARGLGGGLPFRGAIHLVGLDATAAPSTTSLEAEHERVCGSALALVQASAAAGMQGATVLYVTRGAQAVTGQEGALAIAQAPLWGLVRTVQLEHTESRSVLIDLEPSRGAAATQDAVDAILAELGANDGEDQVALRGGQRYAARLTRYTRPASGLQLPAGKPYVITVSERGVLDNIVVRPLERRPPGPGEVEIEVRASGLNFRDVLNVLGMYPGDPGPIGSECAGVVTAVGAGVTHVAVGDRVMAMGQGAFGSHLTTSAHSVYRIPAGMSFAEAASIPVAFMTAYYGLHELARIREGDRVLIHAAAGGVGLAAVQLALRAGAEVFGTAGSPEKREYLKSIGVHHVFNSRTLDFADEIMEVTGGRGVDIVLNSLADEFIPRSLGVLADRGRFLEIGKRGVWTTEQVAEFNPTLEYYLYDLGEALLERPERAAEMLDRLMPEFESGALRPLPLHTFAARDTVDAFRFMAQARHVGKIVITHGDAAGGFPVHADATYLITGGAGGLGLVVARALVERGARHLVLMGRSAPREAASAEIAELAAAGARIEIFRGDVANEDDVARLMDYLATSLPPLRGIVHAAGVVDDGVLLQQTWERFQKVARPKIAGAWNLHAATRALPLDFFVLFSTGSAVLGSAGQGNYAAANAFLDALAHRRRAEGLPALSINWGAWAGGGMAAMVSEHDRRRWSEMGVGLIEPSEGILALERLIADGATQAAVLPMDWARYLGQPGVSERPILRGMLGGARRQQRATGPASSSRPRLREELEAADPARRMEMLIDHVRDRVVKVLGLGPSIHVDERQLLTDLGMDSLMAVELSNHLQASLACKLPPTLAFEYPSIRAMAEYLATDVLGLALPGRDSNGTDAPADGPFVITPIAVTE